MLRVGQEVDNYVVDALIGRGGAAWVFRVSHRRFQKPYALKVLMDTASEHRERFDGEMSLLALLQHPNIIQIHNSFEVDDHPAIVMDYIDGGSLRQRMRMGPVVRPLAIEIFRGIAEGVGAAHLAGIVHRDLKPENILLDRRTGRLVPRVADFGIARSLSAEAVHLTRVGSAMGTCGYMAPESMRGERTDARADVFALGCLLYELLCGRAPFARDTEYLTQVANFNVDYVPPQTVVPDLPLPLVDAINNCLTMDPGERLPGCRALIGALEGHARPPPGQAFAPPPAEAPTVRFVPGPDGGLGGAVAGAAPVGGLGFGLAGAAVSAETIAADPLDRGAPPPPPAVQTVTPGNARVIVAPPAPPQSDGARRVSGPVPSQFTLKPTPDPRAEEEGGSVRLWVGVGAGAILALALSMTVLGYVLYKVGPELTADWGAATVHETPALVEPVSAPTPPPASDPVVPLGAAPVLPAPAATSPATSPATAVSAPAVPAASSERPDTKAPAAAKDAETGAAKEPTDARTRTTESKTTRPAADVKGTVTASGATVKLVQGGSSYVVAGSQQVPVGTYEVWVRFGGEEFGRAAGGGGAGGSKTVTVTEGATVALTCTRWNAACK